MEPQFSKKRAGRRKRWATAGALALGAALTALTLIFPKIGILEWVAMIPLVTGACCLCADPDTGLWRAWRGGFFATFCFYFVLYHWLVNLYPMDFLGIDTSTAVTIIVSGWVGIPILNAIVGGFGFLLFRVMHRSGVFSRVPLLRPFAFAAIWTVLEWCTAQTWMGVPWGRLALGQIEMLPMLGSASLFGSYAVSFLIVAVNGLLAELFFRERRGRILCGVLAAVLFAANLTYGLIWFRGETGSATTVRAAVLQGNISSHEKWDSNSLNRIKTVYGDQARAAAAQGAELIIWPESAIPYDLDRSPSLRAYLSDLARETETTMLVGALMRDENNREYNVLFEVFPDGEFSETVYAKRHLVPFGEYVPMRDLIVTLIPALGEVAVLEDDLLPGTGSEVFTTEWGGIGSLICFDSIYETLALESVRDGAELMVVSSNDSWFYDSAAVYQHEAQAQLRAVETGRWFLRSANTGISTVISPKGETTAWIDPLTEGYAVREVSFLSERTLYSRIGNLFVWVLIAFVLLLAPVADPFCRKKDRKGQL